MLNDLRLLLEKKGQKLVGILLQNDLWVVYAFDLTLGGREPVHSECRDDIDYHLLKSSWEKRCMYVLYVDEDYNNAIGGAIKSLKDG
jgi:hypothetical protein